MRNAVTITLATLVIALLAMNARLRDREQILIERLTAFEKKARLKPLPAKPPTSEPSEPSKPGALPDAVVNSSQPFIEMNRSAMASISTRVPQLTDLTSSEPIPQSSNVISHELVISLDAKPVTQRQYEIWASSARTGEVLKDAFSRIVHEDSSDLGLSDAQKMLIDSLKHSHDAEAQVFRDKLKEIEDRYQQSFRQMLDPEQIKKYDIYRTGVHGKWATFQSIKMD
jgi:hypothetical protein